MVTPDPQEHLGDPEADGPLNVPVRLRGVTKTFAVGQQERTVLHGISLDLHAAQLTVLVGPSGSGKSTLLNIIGGLERPTSGDVLVDGQPVHDMDAERRTALRLRAVGYVFQDYNLLHTMTALENVALPLELAGTRPRAARAAAADALERVGLAHVAGQYPDQLSGGEQQRAAVARALVIPRGLLLADELTGALDSDNTDAMITLLRDLADDGVTCVVATHDAAVADAGDRVIRLRDGHVVDDQQP